MKGKMCVWRMKLNQTIVKSQTLYDTKKRALVFRPGRPGSSLSYRTVCNDRPERIIENCVKNMMKNGLAKRSINKRLKVYLTSDHPHRAQNPIEYNIESY